jgi:hypothetical protein
MCELVPSGTGRLNHDRRATSPRSSPRFDSGGSQCGFLMIGNAAAKSRNECAAYPGVTAVRERHLPRSSSMAMMDWFIDWLENLVPMICFGSEG